MVHLETQILLFSFITRLEMEKKLILFISSIYILLGQSQRNISGTQCFVKRAPLEFSSNFSKNQVTQKKS